MYDIRCQKDFNKTNVMFLSFVQLVPASGSFTLKVEVEETHWVVRILAISFQESYLFLFAIRNAACSTAYR